MLLKTFGWIWESGFGFLRSSWYYFFLRGILAWHFAGLLLRRSQGLFCPWFWKDFQNAFNFSRYWSLPWQADPGSILVVSVSCNQLTLHLHVIDDLPGSFSFIQSLLDDGTCSTFGTNPKKSSTDVWKISRHPSWSNKSDCVMSKLSIHKLVVKIEVDNEA